jgi:hypothetical protein
VAYYTASNIGMLLNNELEKILKEIVPFSPMEGRNGKEVFCEE